MVGMLIYLLWFTFLSIFHQLLLMKKEKVVFGRISEYLAEVLPLGKIQPIVFFDDARTEFTKCALWF